MLSERFQADSTVTNGLGNGGKNGVNGHVLTANGNGVNGGNHSNGCASSVQSDASSWEAVDEKETKPTLWVPDHAVSSCMRYVKNFINVKAIFGFTSIYNSSY